MGKGTKILVRLGFLAATSGVWLWADHKINGEYSVIGMIKKVRQLEKANKKANQKKNSIELNENEYVVV